MSTLETPLTLDRNASLAAAIDLLNKSPITRTIVVVDENGRVVGTLTDGDIRRTLRPESDRAGTVFDLANIRSRDVMNSDPILAGPQDSWFDKVTEARRRERMTGRQIRLIPVLNAAGQLVDVLDLMVSKQRTRLEVILMAKARLEKIDGPPGREAYSPCRTYEAVCKRRARFDTIRYAFEREKYFALRDVIDKEFSSIARDHRLDELYIALTRGQDWARSCRPPSAVLRGKLVSLSKQLEEAKTNLVLRYIGEALASPFLGDRDAAESPDVIFILGCADDDMQKARVTTCVEFLNDLAGRGRMPKSIVLSGGGIGSTETEAAKMATLLKSHKSTIAAIKASNVEVLLEDDSLDTVGNAVFGQLTLIEAQRYSPKQPSDRDATDAVKICVFTSDFHAHRAIGLFQRVFYNSRLAVRYSPTGGSVQDLAKRAGDQLESEARANSETFSLNNSVTGMSMSISSGHVQSVFFQLLRYHDMYRWRPDLIRKYATIMNGLSGTDS